MCSAFGARRNRPDDLPANDEVGPEVKPSSKPATVYRNDAIGQFRPANPARHLSVG